MKEWEQKEILFPKEMYFTTMLRDTTYYNLQSEYKILAYVDSIGCTSCKLQLSQWAKFIAELNSVDIKIPILFFICRSGQVYICILS